MQITGEMKRTPYAAVICNSLDEAFSFKGCARTSFYALRDGGKPYETEIKSVDDLKADEVAIPACGGPPESYAKYGVL